MKNMKKLIVVCLMFLAAGAFQACNNSSRQDSIENAEDSNEIKMDSSMVSSTVDDDGADFLVKAASGGMMEVQLGELAQQKAQSQRVKDFGTMMVKDHSKANYQLKTLATTKNITLPSTLGADHQKHVDDLNKKSGADFDKDYISMMVDDHKEDIDDFDKASKDTKDADIAAFATKTIPVLRMHLDSANAINDALKGK